MKSRKAIRSFLLLSVAAATFSAALLFMAPQKARADGNGQILLVNRLEMAYSPGPNALKVRFILASGMAVEWQPADDYDRDTIFRMADLIGRYPSRMTVTMEDDKITGFGITIP